MSYEDRIKKLNIIEKLLKQEFVSVRKGLGDEKIIREVNEEIRQFLSALMEATFSNVPVKPQFSPETAVVLNEFASRLLSKAGVITPSPVPPAVVVPQSTPPPAPQSKRISPVMEALMQGGFDPNATLEDRKKAVKTISKKIKED